MNGLSVLRISMTLGYGTFVFFFYLHPWFARFTDLSHGTLCEGPQSKRTKQPPTASCIEYSELDGIVVAVRTERDDVIYLGL